MSAEAHFHALAGQIHHLLGCGSVHLLLGCPEPQVRHPLLELFPTNYYHYVGGSADINILLHDEHVRALCDMAIQTGKVQSSNQFQVYSGEVFSIAAAPLERPAGLLGLFLVTNPQAEAFPHGEHLLLSGFLVKAAQSLEQNLLNLYTSLLRPHLIDPMNGSPMALHPANITDGVIITHSTDTHEQKDEFISMVSHELRMPLTSIKGYAELLQAYGIADNPIKEMTPGRQRQYLATIMEQAEHLEVLISDLLDMSSIQAGRLALRFTQVDVAHLCQRVAELAQRRVDQQQPEQYSMRCFLDQQLPLAWADPDRLEQVLTNLLENAIKYSPDGGTIELLVSASHTPHPAHSHLFAEATQALPGTPMLHITIRDQGIGISHQQQALLFKPFSRLEHPTTDQVPGAGLGLFISRKLVEAMHGNVTLRSSEGEGTCVTLTLPGIHDG